ncbi:biotin-dependent carboxyltransferase family protein [Bradyrhizobium arachidis]|uniref:5-oxoprolinase subunit C family protein n=1 Tax=Bradyrhizobium TaxID=374 RepID=UPI002161B571|nr:MULTISPECIES: biotin-dependent carboxyltransferase family protein [Bradyrhizobium]MDN4982974.1 biotin-dependent carboxyltransferase family protein [Bradyrhizobium sp. WYCCWR 13022]UVO34443.1 biotin-dependent carboxyltransferase family protein [Bradyrhizobium arachidis]
MIEILSVTGPASIQDLGRFDQYRFGVGTSGAMDDVALRAGNILLGNDENAANIEIPMMPFKLRFGRDMAFALTGAGVEAEIAARAIPSWWRSHARTGDVLTIKAMSHGARLYLAVSGGIDVPVVLGSRSTQFRGEFGGLHGRPLQVGDILPCAASATAIGELGIEPAEITLARPNAAADETIVRVVVAGEYDAFDDATQALFWSSGWKITPQSNRYGYRLQGPAVKPQAPVEKRSHGIVPGVIQIPPNGQPIIQMRDAQTSGGYPKIATVIRADLWRVGQARLGTKLRFEQTGYTDALAAESEMSAYLDRLRANVRLVEEIRTCR